MGVRVQGHANMARDKTTHSSVTLACLVSLMGSVGWPAPPFAGSLPAHDREASHPNLLLFHCKMF